MRGTTIVPQSYFGASGECEGFNINLFGKSISHKKISILYEYIHTYIYIYTQPAFRKFVRHVSLKEDANDILCLQAQIIVNATGNFIRGYKHT